MPVPAVRRGALGVALAVTTAAQASAPEEAMALQCRFSSGLTAVYMLSRGEARVRRADLLEPREGQVKATAAEYRFIFRERRSAYRIDVIIDRATANARRVFGSRKNMERLPGRHDQGGGLVYEVGQCDAPHSGPR